MGKANKTRTILCVSDDLSGLSFWKFWEVWLDNCQVLGHCPSSSVAPHVQRREHGLSPWAVAALPILSTHRHRDGPWCHGPVSVPCTAPTQPPRAAETSHEFPMLENSLLEHLPHFPVPVSQPARCPQCGRWDRLLLCDSSQPAPCSLSPICHSDPAL